MVLDPALMVSASRAVCVANVLLLVLSWPPTVSVFINISFSYVRYSRQIGIFRLLRIISVTDITMSTPANLFGSATSIITRAATTAGAMF